MCVFSSPPTPVMPAAPAAAPQEQDPAVSSARDAQRKRSQLAAAANDTLVTGGQGLLDTPNTSGNKTAFGA